MLGQLLTARVNAMRTFRARASRIAVFILGRTVRLTDEGPHWLKVHLRPKCIRPTEVIPATGHILGQQPPVERKQLVTRNGVVLVRYQTMHFSFWRSMEHNMITESAARFRSPVLDLGCGDGAFACACLNRVDYGIDLDPVALIRANQLGCYKVVARADASVGIPFASHCFGSVFSNSVVEHIPELSCLLYEVARVLKPDGTFVFSVPGRLFVEYLAQFTGHTDAHSLNQRMGHVNLLSASEWADLLRQHSLEVAYVGHYLSPKAVRIWRILASKGFRRLEARAPNLVWQLVGNWLLSSIRDSLHLPTEGGGMLIVATMHDPAVKRL